MGALPVIGRALSYQDVPRELVHGLQRKER
jgi:hypothetical protein